MYNITIIGCLVNLIIGHIHCNIALYPKLSDLEKVNRLLIANTSAMCQYFSVKLVTISDLLKYFELGLITPNKHNIGYWVSRAP